MPSPAKPVHAASPAESSDSTTCYMRGIASRDVRLDGGGAGAASHTTQGVEFVVARVDHAARPSSLALDFRRHEARRHEDA